MVNIKELLEIDKGEEEDVQEAKKIMEGILEENIEKPFREEDLTSLCAYYKMHNPRVLWKAWNMLVNELEDGATYINMRKPLMGKARPKIYNRLVFENGKSVRTIGLFSVD